MFVLKQSHEPGSWHRSCWVQQILDAAGKWPAELSKLLLLGSPQFRLLLLCNEMGSCSQAGNINYFHELELPLETCFLVERKVTWQVTEREPAKISAVLMPTQQ